jgi:dipeptide/tripeptide permease
MRLTWKDGLATVFVAAAVTLYALWLTDTAAIDLSTRALSGIVLGLGFAGCMTVGNRMTEVFGAGKTRSTPLGYVVVASAAGGVALVAAIVALAAANEVAVAILVGAIVALWVLSTIRHAVGTPRTKKQWVRDWTATDPVFDGRRAGEVSGRR